MSDTESSPAALVVDDDGTFRNRLCRALTVRGWQAHAAGDAEAALELAREQSPDLALVDLRLPDTDGMEIVRGLRALDGTICIIMLTGYGSIASALAAMRAGANHYLSKPADADEILACYERLASGEEEGAPAAVPSLARVEWEHIQRVLGDCGGNITQAARLLKLHRRSLQRKLSKYPPRQ
jgi:two-component system response regulator RegA